MYHQKFSLTELEEMIPFEREFYLILLNEELKRENEELEKNRKKHGY